MKWKQYAIKNGKIDYKSKFCPRCGPGVFMAVHQNRVSCGRCGYTEWSK